VATLMNDPPIRIDPDDSLERAESVMRARHAHHWPVVREHSLLGVVALRNLLTVQLPDSERASHGEVAELRAGHVMTHPLSVLRPADSPSLAAARMIRHRMSCLPVVEDGALVGVVTLEDLVRFAVRLLRAEGAHALTVAHLMTCAPLATVHVLDHLEFAELIMAHYGVRHLPVMDGKRVVGILSEGDILAAIHDTSEPSSAILAGMVMTRDPESVTPEAAAAAAGRLLTRRHIGTLLVVQGARLVGILAKSDFLRYVCGAGAVEIDRDEEAFS
jgi:acetoin utilization protein AcuB